MRTPNDKEILKQARERVLHRTAMLEYAENAKQAALDAASQRVNEAYDPQICRLILEVREAQKDYDTKLETALKTAERLSHKLLVDILGGKYK